MQTCSAKPGLSELRVKLSAPQGVAAAPTELEIKGTGLPPLRRVGAGLRIIFSPQQRHWLEIKGIF